jgi:hypothetical protein
MADITNVFKATVKAVKSRQGNGPGGDVITNILPTSKHRGDFETKARDVVIIHHYHYATLINERETRNFMLIFLWRTTTGFACHVCNYVKMED